MEAKPIDLAHLDHQTAGDKALAAEVLELFVAQATSLLPRLEAFLEAQEARSWCETSHALKGAARGIGAVAFGEAAAEAEALDIAREPRKGAAALKTLNLRAETVKLFVHTYLGR